MALFDVIALLIMVIAFSIPILRGLWERRQRRLHPERFVERERQERELVQKEQHQLYERLYGKESAEEIVAVPVEELEPEAELVAEEPFSQVAAREFEPEVAERELETEVAERKLGAGTVEITTVDLGESVGASRIRELIAALPEKGEMVLLHEVLRPPLGLRHD